MFTKTTKQKILITFGLVIFFIILLFFLFSGENFDLLKSLFLEEHTDEELRDKLNDFGIKGYFTIIILSMVQVIFTFLPAEPVQVIAGITFGFPIGLACCVAGVLLGNTIVYLLYKIYGNKIREYFISNLSIDFEKAARSKKIVLIVFILYFLPAIPYGMICFFAASVGMKYTRYIITTVLGSIPSVCIGVALGHVAIYHSWIISLCVAVLLLVIIAVLAIKRNAFFAKINSFIENNSNPNNTVKKCSPFYLNICYFSLRLVYFLSGIRIKGYNKYGKAIENPSIVLCNHGSFNDFIYAVKMIRKKKPNFIVARLYFYNDLLRTLLRNLGCFPKSMFTADLESTKNCLRVLKNGSVLAMMPEARLSTAGVFEDIQERTYSFLKKSNVPVYTIKISGDYLAKPKWAKAIRRGSIVEVELDILFTAEQINALSVEEIKKAVEERLYYNEFEWLESKPKIKYRSKSFAEGLENILTTCPLCKQKYSLYTKKHDIFCENCGKLTSINNRYAFTDGFVFKNHLEWYNWQKDILEKAIADDPVFTLQSDVELRMRSSDGKTLTEQVGVGSCVLNINGLTYIGTKHGEAFEKHFPLDSIYRLLFGAGEDFEVYLDDEIYYFVPSDKRSCVEWYLASMILYDKNKKSSD